MHRVSTQRCDEYGQPSLLQAMAPVAGQQALEYLDRLWLAYTSDRLVARVGRQAISRGNGMVYNTLDLFNPFAPDGSEFGGLDTAAADGRLLTPANTLFARLAGYC